MSLVTNLLLLVAIVFACIFLNNLSSKTGIPYLLAFIALGMVLGSDGLATIHFDDYALAEHACSVALIFIMFYGGFGINWQRAKERSVAAFTLASAGVVITAVATGVFCHVAFGTSWPVGMLMGSVVSSTDAASVFSVLRSRRLNLKHGTAPILEMESGSNDPASLIMTTVFLAVMQGVADVTTIGVSIFLQVSLALVFGFLVAGIAIWVMRRVRFANDGFDIVFVVGIALLAYALPAAFGGNGYLAAYVSGICVGNASVRDVRKLVNFFDGMTAICQMLIFLLLGLLSFPSRLPGVAGMAAGISVFLLLVARPLAVLLVGRPFGMSARQMAVISMAGLRGASSAVFAIMVLTQATLPVDLFHVVFLVVLVSISLQGSLLPYVARRLDMVDASEDVMRTFNDYVEETSVNFIRILVEEGSAWEGRSLNDVTLPPSTLAVMLERGEGRIVPDGTTVLMPGDLLVLVAPSANDGEVIHISRRDVEAGSAFAGRRLSELPRDLGLVVTVQRGADVMIPNGDTMICEGDSLLIHHEEAASPSAW